MYPRCDNDCFLLEMVNYVLLQSVVEVVISPSEYARFSIRVMIVVYRLEDVCISLVEAVKFLFKRSP